MKITILTGTHTVPLKTLEKKASEYLAENTVGVSAKYIAFPEDGFHPDLHHKLLDPHVRNANGKHLFILTWSENICLQARIKSSIEKDTTVEFVIFDYDVFEEEEDIWHVSVGDDGVISDWPTFLNDGVVDTPMFCKRFELNRELSKIKREKNPK